jgi:peptidoglycan/LPS O-acetylase OafA/YrhL
MNMFEFIRSDNPLRFYAFDIFRVLACIAIILTHLRYGYPVTPGLEPVFSFLGYCGLTIFFFFSGFFISHYPLDNGNDSKKFWTGRLKRLIPALYVAIFVYCVVEALHIGSPDWNIPLNLWSILSNILCLQVFFHPLRFFGMWYVGALLFMYLIHTCIRRLVHDTTIHYIFLAFLFYPLVVLVNTVHLPVYGFGFEPRVMEFYFVFMTGSISGRIFERKDTNEIYYPFIVFMFLLLKKVLFYFFGLNDTIFNPDDGPVFLTLAGLVLYLFWRKIRISAPLQSLPRIVMMGSYASYCAYLLQYPVLCILAATGIQNLYLFAFLAVFLSFSAGYLLQNSIDSIFDKKRKFRSSR